MDLPARVVITSCAQVPKEAGFGDVQKLVNQKFDYRLYWNQGSTVDEQVARAIEDLLKAELSVDGAVQIALLNNQPAKSEKRSGRIDTVFLILVEFTSVINALDCPWDVTENKIQAVTQLLYNCSDSSIANTPRLILERRPKFSNQSLHLHLLHSPHPLIA